MDIDEAQYTAWSRTWEASIRQSSMNPREVVQRTVRCFRTLTQRIDPAVTLEIGAHEASFSRWASEALPSARVLAFEANPHVHEKYAEGLAATRVDYQNLAVGPVNGEVVLNLPTEVRGRGRTLTSPMASLSHHRQAGSDIQVTVPSVRLGDHLTLGADERAVAWIDVEGANEPVLRGAGDVLSHLDALFIEVEKTTTWEGQWLDTDVNAFLREHGFVAIARDAFPRRRHQYNVLYARAALACDRRTARLVARVLNPRRTKAQTKAPGGPRKRDRNQKGRVRTH